MGFRQIINQLIKRESNSFDSTMQPSEFDLEHTLSMEEQIKQLYDDIYTESQVEGIEKVGIEHFHFDEMISDSPFRKKDKKSATLFVLQKNIFSLAINWDEWVNEYRTKNGYNTRGQHLFFLTYSGKTNRKAFSVNTFNSHQGPDKRLVGIIIKKRNGRQNYKPILHEMGHVIGCRSREQRREKLFEFLLLSILQEVFLVCMAEANRQRAGIPLEIPQYDATDFYSRKWWEIGEPICHELEKIYALLLQKFNPINGSEVSTQEGETKEISYAEKFVSETSLCIANELAKEETWTIIDSDLVKVIKTAYTSVKEREKTPFKSISRNVIDIFEEPAADCFMIKIYDLTPKEYLDMVIDEALNTWRNTKERIDDNFLQYMSSDILRYRVLSVCYAMIEERVSVETDTTKQKEKREKEISDLFYCRRKVGNKFKARRMFKDMYQKERIADHDNFIQQLLNPQYIVSDYLYNQVFQHEHYKQVFDSENYQTKNLDATRECIDNIRKWNIKEKKHLRPHIFRVTDERPSSSDGSIS